MSNYYSQFLSSIKERIRKSQYEALKVVNKGLIDLYWDIGGMILDRQNKHGWGKAIVEKLSKDLQNSRHWREKLPGDTIIIINLQ